MDVMARRQSTSPRRRTAPAATPACCSVCGSNEIAVDEVWERGLWLLSQCGRCENRWTEGPIGGPRGPVARVAAMPVEEHVEAA